MLMETYNRFCQTYDLERNVYIAAASTGKAAVAIDGTTVHSAFNIKIHDIREGMKPEKLHEYRLNMKNVRVIFIEEISMIGSRMFHLINQRLTQITSIYDLPFGGYDIFFCGDLRQLPPVHGSAIFDPLRTGLCRNVLWQSLSFFPLQQVSLERRDVVVLMWSIA